MGVKGLKGKLTIQRSAHWKFSGFPMSSLVILFLVFFLLFDALLLLSFLSLLFFRDRAGPPSTEERLVCDDE